MKFVARRSSRYFGDPNVPGSYQESVIVDGLETMRWVIDILSLEDLLGLMEPKATGIVIGADNKSDLPFLEIYDSYRE